MMYVFMFAALCMGSMVPCAEGTFSWFTKSNLNLPPFTLPKVCGTRVFVPANVSMPVSGMGEDEDCDPMNMINNAWPWVVQIGMGAAGILLSEQHVITLGHCLDDYTNWYGGYNTINVRVLDHVVDAVGVQIQDGELDVLPLAILTLKTNLSWIPAPMCVGELHRDLIAAAVGWGIDGSLRQKVVGFYKSAQCLDVFSEAYYEPQMVCGNRGPGDCGAPLIQNINGSWILVGLGVGDQLSIARYVLLQPSLQWLENP